MLSNRRGLLHIFVFFLSSFSICPLFVIVVSVCICVPCVRVCRVCLVCVTFGYSFWVSFVASCVCLRCFVFLYFAIIIVVISLSSCLPFRCVYLLCLFGLRSHTAEQRKYDLLDYQTTYIRQTEMTNV